MLEESFLQWLKASSYSARHGISKENTLYLNRHGYFERVPFASSIPEFDVGLDHKRQLQPAELFKHPFSVELMGAGFDKSA